MLLRRMLWLLVVTSLAASPADQITSARAALDELRYDDALAALPAREDLAELSRDQVVAWAATRALALAALKRDAEATAAFTELYCFAHDWTVPDEYGPRVRTLALEAKDAAARAGVLSVAFSAGRLEVTKDTHGWGEGLELTWKEAGGPPKTVQLPLESLAAPWPTNVPVDAWARVTGLKGSTVYEWGSPDKPMHFEPAAAPPPVATGPGFFSRPLTVTGVAVAGAGLIALIPAGIFAGQSKAADDALASASRDAQGRITSLTQREAFVTATRADSAATLSGVFFVAAGVLVASGVGLVVYDRMRVTPAPGGVGLLVPLDATFGIAGEAP